MLFLRQLLKYLTIIILLLALKLLLIGVDKPFWGHHDWNSVVYSNIARNYLRYGYLATKFGQVRNVDFQSPSSFSFITHYPPLLPILISFSFKFLGQSETSARLVAIAFSLILVYFIYKLGQEIHSTFLGIICALATILTPIFLYFGKLPVHDIIVPATSVFGLWAYVKFIKEKKLGYYLLLITTIVMGGFINWSAFYLVLALSYHQLLVDTKFREKKIFALIPLCLLVFSIHMLHLHLLGTESDAFSNIFSRVNPYISADLYGFSLFEYVKQELLLTRQYFSLPISLGSFLFILKFVSNLVKRNFTFEQTLISALFVYGIIQIVAFPQLSFIHDYMIYYMLPFMVISFAYITLKILYRLKDKVIYPIIIIVLVSFIFLDRLPFTRALLATSMHKRGFYAAQIIKAGTISGEKAFISSNSYKEFEEVFIAYYSDREVAYGEELPDNFMNSYKLIIRPKDHDALDTRSKQLLDEKLKRYESDDFIWYKIL